MAQGIFKHVHIVGICVALPTQKYSTEDIAKDMDERAIKRFIKATGVKNRFLSVHGQTTSDLCYIAASELFKKKVINRSEVDAVLFVSQNPDYKRPSTAIIMQERLGLQKNCMAFDINLGCSGYVYGLYTLAAMIEGGGIKKALLLTGDVNRDIDGEYLFGDGASATIIEYGNDTIEGILKSDGSGYKAIYIPEGGQRVPIDENDPDWEKLKVSQHGAEVFEFSITQVPDMLMEFQRVFKRPLESYDYIILHQANLMILRQIITKLHLSPEQVPISIQKYGNVSSASIPIAIAELFSDMPEKKKLKLLLSGFGVGLSLGAVSIELSKENVLPIVFSDYVWDGIFSEEVEN